MKLLLRGRTSFMLTLVSNECVDNKSFLTVHYYFFTKIFSKFDSWKIYF
ncbi:hypothetical protein SRABI27_04028 [Pedobacter sp. Bi27]|nr:hypothetical protein SRABI36_03420 [Pedobacter sp. Bi36]CAH0286123.1 hypothetical protein SRABI126_03914 [Pedobacter sp. Bi126]CAH0289632.1 hypothetical protein SRABI27_04028 [Pedobacter sp. Bi27]